jgi:hypothetical protein
VSGKVVDSVGLTVGCRSWERPPSSPEPEHPGYRVALEHKRAVAGRLRERAEAAGANDPDDSPKSCCW